MKPIGIAFTVLILAGCAAAPHATNDAVRIDVTGDYAHAPTRLTFPATVAGFDRVTVFRRDADAQRITVAYAGTPGPCLAAVTLWVDPVAGSKLDDAYAAAKREVLEAYPSAAPVREESGRVIGHEGRRGDFDLDDRRLDMVVMQLDDAWYLRYRVIYPARCGEEATKPVGDFFHAWWQQALAAGLR